MNDLPSISYGDLENNEASVEGNVQKRQRLHHSKSGHDGSLSVLPKNIQPLPVLGAEVTGWTSEEIAALHPTSEVLSALAEALSAHSLLVFHGRLLAPSQLRALYTNLHKALGMGCAPPVKKSNSSSSSESLRGACFPGYPETNVLGSAEKVQDWHGLSGFLRPEAWWEETNPQFHHDGGFSALSPPPPAIVAMYCEETPSRGSSILKWDNGAELAYGPGSTLFYSTRLAVNLAPTEIVQRARLMTCVYRRGFGQVKRDVYPLMSSTGLVPLSGPVPGEGSHRSVTDAEFVSLENLAFDGASPPKGSVEALYRVDEAGCRVFSHALIQRDSMGDFAFVHAVCLDHLEEQGKGSLTWEESIAFIEQLLAPAARPPHLLAFEWKPGDVVVFDNRCTQHSVTPTHRYGLDAGYAALGERRLMTRTAMQPSWLPQMVEQTP